jgi:siroheme synthase (precorrin-2 oxidase/ferrochelatase)
MAKRLRQQLEATFSPVYGSYLELAALARSYLRQYGVSYATRDDFVSDFMASSILTLLNSGAEQDALVVVADLLHTYGVEVPVAELERELGKERGNAVREL